MSNISEEAQVSLLLFGTLGKQAEGAEPLTLSQFNVFEEAVTRLGHRLTDLLTDESIIDPICKSTDGDKRIRKKIEADNILKLIRRGVLLSFCLEKWSPYGITVLCRSDPLYPKRLLSHLGNRAPPVIYYAGNSTLLTGGGMAYVGARDASNESLDAVRTVVKLYTDRNEPTVSGGARGVDETSMTTALELGGSVIGALSGDLMKTCVKPTYRDALAAGKLLLFTAVDPSVGFTPINAMERNKYIYAMADTCFVAQSGTDGGTWSGAVEELKRVNHRLVYVFEPADAPEGNRLLISKGGVAWKPGFDPFNTSTPAIRVALPNGQASLDFF